MTRIERVIEPQDNNFSFMMDITKAFTQEGVVEGPQKMVIRGIASNTKRDLQDDRFSVEGLMSIKKAIEEGIYDDDGEWTLVPLLNGHQGEWDDVLGYVTKAEIDDDENLWITAELDEDNPKSTQLHRKLTKGNANGKKAKLGLSVKGKVTKYRLVYDDEIRKASPLFDNLLVKEISVTQQPVNPTPYPLAIAKSLTHDPEYISAKEDIMAHLEIAPSNTLNTLVAEGVDAKEDPITIAISKAQEATDEANVEVAAEETEAANAAESHEEVVIAADQAEHPVIAAQHEAETSHEVEEETVATNEDDRVANLVNDIANLSALVQRLNDEITSLRATDVQKAVTEETPAASVEVSDASDLDARIESAVERAISKAMAKESLETMTNEMQVIKSQLAKLSEEPADRSISVQKSKDEDDESPELVVRKRIQEGEDPLKAAFGAAYGSRSPWR